GVGLVVLAAPYAGQLGEADGVDLRRGLVADLEEVVRGGNGGGRPRDRPALGRRDEGHGLDAATAGRGGPVVARARPRGREGRGRRALATENEEQQQVEQHRCEQRAPGDAAVLVPVLVCA